MPRIPRHSLKPHNTLSNISLLTSSLSLSLLSLITSAIQQTGLQMTWNAFQPKAASKARFAIPKRILKAALPKLSEATWRWQHLGNKGSTGKNDSCAKVFVCDVLAHFSKKQSQGVMGTAHIVPGPSRMSSTQSVRIWTACLILPALYLVPNASKTITLIFKKQTTGQTDSARYGEKNAGAHSDLAITCCVGLGQLCTLSGGSSLLT